MVSARLAILLVGIFTLGIFVPAVESLEVPTVEATLPGAGTGPTGLSPIPSQATPSDPSKTLTPFGVVPTPPSPSPTGGFASDGQGFEIDGPYGALVQGLLEDGRPTPNTVAARLTDYFHQMGFDTPGAALSFEENATTAYSHDLGDIDQDGVTDFVLDQYCLQQDACMPRFGALFTDPRGQLDTRCSFPHKIVAVSGATGFELWNYTARDENPALGMYQGCSHEFVVGGVPDGDHHDYVLYQYSVHFALTYYQHVITGPSQVLINHRIHLLDGATGRPGAWSKTFSGYFLSNDNQRNFATADNLLVHPIVQAVRTQGVDYLPEGTKAGIVLQGVGFNITRAGGPVLPYAVRPLTLLNSYQPDEWAMGVDALKGTELWSRLTFQPNGRIQGINLPRAQGVNPGVGNTSVIPRILQVPPIPHTTCMYDGSIGCRPAAQFPYMQGPRANPWYWGYDPCCYDITGDQLPDIVYTVLEFYSMPAKNEEGPYGVRGFIVALDGATGKELYKKVVEPDISVPLYTLNVQHLGDVNNDGAADYFVLERHIEFDYKYEVEVVSGKDGSRVWNMTSPRALQLLPLGDADKDGSVDFAFIDYTFDVGKTFMLGLGAATAYSTTNVTHTDIRVRSGATGAIIWEYRTFEAPLDIFSVYNSYRLNGLPDFDGDNVGELLVDDPLYLPDLTKIHRYTYRSGADGTILFKFVAAGLFSFPALAGDVTGDGKDDVLIINGDILDLWGTLYSGNGTAVWSRRVMTTRTASYSFAFPLIRTHFVTANGSIENDFMLNFQLFVVQVFRTAFSGGIFAMATTKPQMVRYGGDDGTVGWAVPAFWDQNMTVVVEGMSPASQTYATAHLFDPQRDRVDAAPLATPIQVATGTATFGAAFALSFFLGLRRWKP